MTDLETFKQRDDIHIKREDWISFSCTLGSFAHQLSNKEDIHTSLLETIDFVFSIAKKYDINMNDAWERWYKKAYYKQYT